MRLNYVIIIAFTLMLPIKTEAQQSKKKAAKPKQSAPVKKKANSTEAPKGATAWGVKNYKGNSHIYYPDYHAFYDPNRGYVYWNVTTSNWTTSKDVPSFMSNVDMRRTRVEILEGLSLDLYPERNYPNYMKLYPARIDDPRVPVPNHRQERR